MDGDEAEFRIVENIYKETTAVVIAERETSEHFGVGVGLRQGSALSPLLLFIMVMNLISGKVSEQEELKKILYADDLAVVADNKKDLQKTLQEWSNTFRKHGLQMNLEKTEVMWIGEQEVDLHVVVDGKAIKQVNRFVYLGGTLCEDGGSSKDIQRVVQLGAATWKRVEGIVWDRKLKKHLKGKVLKTCVVPACIYGLGTLALTERQEEKMQIAENNWVRRICKITQEDRRKVKELREEIDIKNT